ncbi:unnamed protein product [Paramecium sonneborni]|uniref:Transmembrane protein n=1 Tax=Paramecium sonneborni TaxID=65129 RepID=A0A8S1RDY4_9CILI|nr:unnamed protein product [Paramecium sonneborni]
MDPLYQIYRYHLKQQNFNYPYQICFQYGIWSKYNPLSIISQVGLIGIFDSNCYQFHHAVEQTTKSLILIYYVCIDQEKMSINKFIEFSNDFGEQFKFEVPIDIFQLEDQWYYFGIAQWPSLNRCEIIIFSEKQVLFSKIISISYIYQNQDIILTVGGGFVVNKSKINTLEQGRLFSYFPGTIYIDFFEITATTPGTDLEVLAKEIFTYDYLCQINTEIQISDQELSWLDQYFYSSENINWDSFTLSGWLKILKIVNVSNEFIYEFFKLGPNFENSRLSNPNYSPFIFYYKISPSNNQIIITTYSYTIPFLGLDLQNNPFIIKKSLDITNNLYLWHKFSVKQQQNKITINIKFWEGHNIYEYSVQFDVIQFHRVQYKLTYGNNQQSPENYLNIKVQNLIFLNCESEYYQSNCHSNCLECDGPNDNDCLSCSVESRRIYLPDQKSCICPYDLVEDENCKSYEDYNFEQVEEYIQKDQNQCQYGYFELGEDCIQCPSIKRDNYLTCLECLQNPKDWGQNPICINNIYLDSNGNIHQKIQDMIESKYLFDGIDLKFCEECEQDSISNPENIIRDYFITSIQFKEFCLQNKFDLETAINFDNQICYDCGIYLCKICIISINGFMCTKCQSNIQVKNGKCTVGDLLSKEKEDLRCIQPLYKNSMKQCQLCQIENCIYCFEYLSNDLSKSTLYLDFETFLINENFKVGCALCKNNFIFNFITGKCIYQQPQIKNCARSFINQDNQEVCTLSSNEDFNVSPEISNCQKYLSNCLQCIMTPESIIKCIICQIGYTTQIISGQCKPNNIENAKIVIQGDFLYYDGFMQRLQSFMIQFLPNQYFYLRAQGNYRTSNQIIECQDGYKLNSNFRCNKYCSSECQSCSYSNIESSFQCLKCPLNQYKTFIRSQESGSCLQCPQFCEVCQNRSDNELKNYKDSTSKYSKKCLKPIQNPNIVLDQYSQIARLCYNQKCNNALLFLLDFFNTNPIENIDNKINIQYCNEIGLSLLIIQLDLQEDYQFVSLYEDYPFDQKQDYVLFLSTFLKSSIFSLIKINLRITQPSKYVFQVSENNLFKNFDEVEFLNFELIFSKNTSLMFENEQSQVSFNFTNLLIRNGFINSIFSTFHTSNYGNIYFNNLLFQDVQFLNCNFLHLESQKVLINVTIDTLTLQNCNLINSNLFSFLNTQVNVIVQNLNINQCNFTNSTIFLFSTNLPLKSFIDVKGLNILQCEFKYSNFINSTKTINIRFFNILFQYNQVNSSVVISYSDNLWMYDVNIFENYFIDSKFASIIQGSENRITSEILNFEANENIFQKSYLCQIISISLKNNLILQLMNIRLNKNIYLITLDGYYPLFSISCIELLIKNAQIIDQNNCKIFNIFDSFSIILEDINYQNSVQNFKVPLNQNCASQNEIKNQLLSIQGVLIVKLNNFMIFQQTSFDLSLIDLAQSRQNLVNQFKEIIIYNLTFNNNLLIQQYETNFFSLITISSETNIKIIIDNLRYNQNFLHQQTDDILELSSSLLFISCSACSIKINNIQCQNNGLTNSSNSFILINVYFVQFNNFTIQNHNYLPQNLWEQFYDFKLNEILSDEDIDHLMQQTFKILNKGGAGSIIASEFYCFNCSFINIRSFKSSLFDIKTQAYGIIELYNIFIKLVLTQASSISDSSGCINIYSQNSMLNLQIQHASFIEIFNSMKSSILSIIPSQKQNKIILVDVRIINCLSFMNQMMKIIFPIQSLGKNKLIMKKIKIKQNDDDWVRFFQVFGVILGQSEIKEIGGDDNALLYIDRCDVTFIDLEIEGIFISSLFQIKNALQVLLINCKFIQIQTFQFQDLIYLTYSKDQKPSVSFKKVNIEKIQQFDLNLLNPFIESKQNYNIIYCEICKSDQQPQKIEHPIINFMNQIKKIQKENSIIFIQGSSSEIQLNFDSLNLNNINCQTCSNGLIYVESDSFNQFKIQDFDCNYNNVNQYGCLNFKMKAGQNKLIKIIKSNFMFNKGGQGAGITATNISLQIQQCRFINNTVLSYGGGLYLELNSSNFQIKQSVYIYNQAAFGGGGIYLSNDSNLVNQNLIQSIINFNKAEFFGNNIVEAPTHLVLNINNLEMQSQIQNINNTQNHILQINPYKTIQQGQLLFTNYLMIPSNQEIKQYKLYIPEAQKFKIYLQNIVLTWRNNQNEYLQFNGKSTCEIIQNTLSKNQVVQGSTVSQILEYDLQKQHFDFGSLSFSFDPYINGFDEVLQIQLNCKNIQYQQILHYVVNLKSFKCQLGEFYVKEGCQLCQQNQGYYSVTYDALKCSIFDKTKFLNVTSNNIQLKNGFWRPHYLSDFTEYCFKNEKFCQGGWKTGNELCYQGRIGGLCEECDHYNIRGDGYYFKDSENNCLNCSNASSLIAQYIILSIWVLLSIILTLRSIDKTNKLFATLKIRQKIGKIIFKLNQDHEGILIKLFLNYFWIFSIIFTFNVEFSFSFDFIDKISNTSNFLANSLDCYLADYQSIQLIYSRIIVLPFLMGIQFLVIIIGIKAFSIVLKQQFGSSIISNTLLYLYVSNYAGLVKQLCSILSKREISNTSYIQGDVSLLYGSNNHKIGMLLFALPGLGIFSCLIPISLFFLMYIKRDKLDDIKLRRHICYLFNEYHHKRYYWEQIKLTKKTIIILIVTQFETNTFLKVSLLGLSLLFYQLLVLHNKPYAISRFNYLDLQSGQICLIAIFIAAAKYASQQYNDSFSSFIFQITIMLLCIKLGYSFIFNLLKIYYKKYRIQIITLLFQLFKKINPNLRLSKYFNNLLSKWQAQDTRLKSNYSKLRFHLFSLSKINIRNFRNPSLSIQFSTTISSVRNQQTITRNLLSREGI